MLYELAVPRRMTTVTGPDAGSEAGSADHRAGGTPLDDVLEILEGVVDRVRAGQYAANEPEGVLVDAIVGTTRCLLLVHEPSMLVRLSPRSSEIARMVANGRTNQAIAGALDISIWTVSSHLRRIFAKLAVCSRTETAAHLLGQRSFASPPR